MSDPALDRSELSANLEAMLEAVTGRPWDILKVPEPVDVPYGIIYPLPGGMIRRGALSVAEHMIAVVYQLTVAGLRDDQVDKLASLARAAVVGTTNEAFTNAIAAPTGFKIIDRTARPAGLLSRVDTVYQRADIFTFTLTAA